MEKNGAETMRALRGSFRAPRASLTLLQNAVANKNKVVTLVLEKRRARTKLELRGTINVKRHSQSEHLDESRN